MTDPATHPTTSADTLPKPTAMQVGSLRVTALQDGHFDLPTAFLTSPTGESPIADATFNLDVNAFLIQDANRNILVDTGCGSQLGPTVNKLVPSLRAAGLAPSDIDAVLCTHIHPDHTNGLIDAQGSAIYTNAQVFVHQNEIDFWLNDGRREQATGELRQSYEWAHEAFSPYAGRIEPFRSGGVLAGIEAIPLFGHTPGHCGFQFDGGGTDQLIIWGDVVHNIEVQAREPEISVLADVNQSEARSTRLSIFDRVTADDVLVTGMHVKFPGFGRLRRAGAGYEFTPDP
ncbi:MBL fold metallo-hydrolase [Sphingobium yanoikuyae]|nr:MBL fold metallo-hydrolase [Sphingobium yanoikuyae]